VITIRRCIYSAERCSTAGRRGQLYRPDHRAYYLAFARLGYNNIRPVYRHPDHLLVLLVTNAAAPLSLPAAAPPGGQIYLQCCRQPGADRVPVLLASLIYRPKNFRSLLKAGIIFAWMGAASLPQTVYGNAVSRFSQRKVFSKAFSSHRLSSIYLHGMPAFDNAAHMVVGETTLFFAPALCPPVNPRVFRHFSCLSPSYLVTEHFISSPLAGRLRWFLYRRGAMALAGLKQRRLPYY